MVKDIINYVAKVWLEDKEVHQFDMFISDNLRMEIEEWIKVGGYSNDCEFWHPWATDEHTLVSLFIMDDEVAAHFRLQWEELAH